MKFVDLNTQFKALEPEIRAAIERVLTHGQFVMGPEVFELEEDLAGYTGAKHVVSCSSGTDALLMVLMAWEIGPGDAVFTTPFTFVATAEVIARVGAIPVFVDIDPRTYNIDPARLEEAVFTVKRGNKLRAKAVIPVDLFGLPADYDAIGRIANKHDLTVLADGCQSFGGKYRGKKVGTLGDATATSFFPAKPLGAYGDGGAVFTDDDHLAGLLRSIRIHGMGENQYDNVRIGITGRLDTLQAAILRCKLAVFDQELEARQRIANVYDTALSDRFTTPHIPDGYRSAWAQYTIQAEDRELLRQHLASAGIPSAVYYPAPLHKQPAFPDCNQDNPLLPVSESLSESVVSLPIHPYLTQPDQLEIIEGILHLKK
ncbi:MAG: DegT/DnrJ/EryC1/StrS family aminotransferase [Pseudomonadota bacterium]|nr:DegT/DnrJ/EryC1/StrS family aminotransferase [Pseudomonadota bacterium]